MGDSDGATVVSPGDGETVGFRGAEVVFIGVSAAALLGIDDVEEGVCPAMRLTSCVL